MEPTDSYGRSQENNSVGFSSSDINDIDYIVQQTDRNGKVTETHATRSDNGDLVDSAGNAVKDSSGNSFNVNSNGDFRVLSRNGRNLGKLFTDLNRIYEET
jgi:hypothetical protein